MRNFELAAELAILLAEGAQDKKGSIGIWYANYRTEFPEGAELEARFRRYQDWLDKALPNLSTSRFRRPVEYYSLVGGLDEVAAGGYTLDDLDASKANKALMNFQRECAKEEPIRLAARYLQPLAVRLTIFVLGRPALKLYRDSSPMSDEADKSLRQTHREFREWYASNLPFCKALADTAHDYLEERLTDAGIPVHAVFARSKDPLTLMEKVRRKGYVSPREEVTDLVGARVIVQYLDEVEPAASLVRHALVDIDEAHSIDKGKTLATREFGYRSIHIVAKLPVEVLDIRGLPREPSLGVEVQVRTIFEHAWAEIEHEVVYKSGIQYPDDFRRRFSAVAGTLEILEREFMLMRSFRRDLIDEHKEKYQSLKELKQSFDAARLIAYFEVSRSSGRGWRRAEAEGNPFARNSEARWSRYCIMRSSLRRMLLVLG